MDICRLCCSTKFVNNYIFDEENALYVKMSLYLPIKVFKNDRLPQKICDKCSCKVNDFYQFCNETIEIQNRLHATLLAFSCSNTSTVDLSVVKTDTHSPLSPAPYPQPHLQLPQQAAQVSPRCDQTTQTDLDITPTFNYPPPANNVTVKVKIEPNPPSPPVVKIESDFIDTNSHDTFNDVPSDNSDDVSLINLKKNKLKEIKNGSVCENNKGKRKKLKKNARADISVFDIKPISDDSDGELKLSDDLAKIKKKVKKELSDDDVHHCCICFEQCHSRPEMLKHYKQHGRAVPQGELPPPPPPPDTDPMRCPRCKKTVAAGGGGWAAHWLRHLEQDTRPYRCAVCARTYRTHVQILKHGQTHKYVEEGGAEPMDSRFFCDLCPEGFVYMRCLVSHRTLAHPEALARPLAVRCGCCERTFAHLNSLRRHVRAHDGQRDHLCYVCGKALSSREHLKFHIRIHTGYKPNVCKTCGKGFVKKCNLTLHERVHSGEKPHVCSHCGKAFSQRSTLVIHERYHSGARPYVCALCGRGFVAKGLLSMHLKTTCI